jgi:hypothetical protein
MPSVYWNMSEYVTVHSETTADPHVIEILTNQHLADSQEVYLDAEAGSAGSPIAQMLFEGVPGIRALTIWEDSLLLTRDPDYPWEAIVDDVRDALRDFFL